MSEKHLQAPKDGVCKELPYILVKVNLFTWEYLKRHPFSSFVLSVSKEGMFFCIWQPRKVCPEGRLLCSWIFD